MQIRVYFYVLCAGDVTSIIIDTYTVTPGPRVLTIGYTDIAGGFRIIEYTFFGRVSPRESCFILCHTACNNFVVPVQWYHFDKMRKE